MKYIPFLFLLLLSLYTCSVAEQLSLEEMLAAEDVQQYSDASSVPAGESTVRSAWIDEMIELSESLYRKAAGKPQRAQYSGDIYICKNYTVNLFRETAGKYRMAAYPDVPLIIPNNQKKENCLPYNYGIEWEERSPEEGNPFYAAATFRYDDSLSKAQNEENAMAFMRQVRKGDFFQMSADYYYGIGAHSLVFIADYDPDTDMVHWTDSNMKGETKNCERYAYIQFDAEKEIAWFVDAFCHKKRGATLYRLRDDIILAN